MALMMGAGGLRRNWLAFALVAAVTVAAVAPTGLAFSKGICTGCASPASAPAGDFDNFGCTACHGTAKTFPPVDNSAITIQVVAADGTFANGAYAKEATYTLAIRFHETNAPAEANHAGFNLRVTGGELDAVAGQSQVSSDKKQATHVGADRTAWNVTWKAPASGPVSFRLFVNDVDGSGAPDAADQVHQVFFGLTDGSGAALGAPATPEEPHYGIALQQYWIGLIALAGMVFIMVAGYVYLKYGSKHNTDAKDR